MFVLVLVLVVVFVLPGFDGELGFGLYGLRQCQFPQIYISEVHAGTDCEHFHGLQILSTVYKSFPLPTMKISSPLLLSLGVAVAQASPVEKRAGITDGMSFLCPTLDSSSL